MPSLNTLPLDALEQAFHRVVGQYGAQVNEGIRNGHVKLEDGLPWFEVDGRFTTESAAQFVQDLATEMNLRVLFNRLESYASSAVVYGVFDMDPKAIVPHQPVPALSNDPDAREFMEDYGDAVLQQPSAATDAPGKRPKP